jgi:hypothetical protein
VKHNIIRDEAMLKHFIDWLPELGADEVFFLALQARRKYLPTLKGGDKTQLRRFASTKRRLFDRIRQLESPVGSYTADDGTPIPDEGLALYITPNPRSLRKATFESIKALAGLLQHPRQDLEPHSEVLRQIHKAKSRTAFVHFDLDLPTGEPGDADAAKCAWTLDEIWNKTTAVIGEKAVEIIRTRGGCHVLITPDLVRSDTKKWYAIVHQELNCDQVGDIMLPVVGCCQGGFVPHFYRPASQA